MTNLAFLARTTARELARWAALAMGLSLALKLAIVGG